MPADRRYHTTVGVREWDLHARHATRPAALGGAPSSGRDRGQHHRLHRDRVIWWQSRSARRAAGTAAWIALGLYLAFCVALRFVAYSDLWLDEAQTVDIARHPIVQIPSLLRLDGSPPLYYLMLHGWMAVFGTGNLAVRSLSGIFGVVTLGLAVLAARRLGGAGAGWGTLAVLASSPFAIYYDTEARPYALVVLITVLGWFALCRVLERPRALNLAALAACVALLLYTQYWSLYLVGAVGLLCMVRVLWLWRRRGRPEVVPPLWAIGAICVGVALFLPWVPSFIFQARHTGTPWAPPANFDDVVLAIRQFANAPNGPDTATHWLAPITLALIALAILARPLSRSAVRLDLRGHSPGRVLGAAVLITLVAAMAGGEISHSAYSDRYASVVFFPVVLLVGLGVACFSDRRVRTGLVVVIAGLGLVTSVPNIWTNRTQAGAVARVINAAGQPGDVVAYCPDQLGPATQRLLHSGFIQLTFPRDLPPAIVDWVDYAAVNRAGDPAGFARFLRDLAGPDHAIWVVWAPGYLTYGSKCQSIVASLERAPGMEGYSMVSLDPGRYYEPMNLTEVVPVASALAQRQGG